MDGYRLRALFFAFPILSLAACSGGGSSTSSSGLLPQAAAASAAVPVTVTLHVPQATTTQSAARNKEYISSATASAKLTVQAADGTTTGTTANCTNVCTLSTQIAPGAVQLSMSLYSGQNATGSMLSSGSMNTTIAQGRANSISVALGGVIASLSLSLAANTFTLGTPTSTTLNVSPLDASGNQIVGAQAFATPISLAITNNGAGEFTLASSSLTSPASDSVGITFNGGSTAASPTITASINGTAITANIAVSTRSAINLTSMSAVSSSAFIDSIGINTHINYPVYANSFTTVLSLLTNAGIHHVRDGFASNPASAAVYFGYLQQMQRNGIRATMGTSINMPVATILANTAAVPNFTEAIEAPNEYDLSGDSAWAGNLGTYQRTLYAGVKATPALASIPVIGPALTSVSAYAQLGNLSSYMDYGNMHDYFAGFNPGTGGYGGGGFGSVYGTIAYNIGEAGQVSGSKPVIATETGYCTIPNTRNAVTPAIESRYIPRMYLEQWLAGVPRTIQYELIDEGGGGCNGSYGLLTSSLTPKPGYYALQHLIAAISDGASSSTPTALPMNITSPATSVHHLLFEKANGTYVLALWNEVSSWDVNNGTGLALNPAAVSVIVTLGANPSSSSISTINDDGSMTSGSLLWAGGTSTTSVDDHVTLLTLNP